MKRIIAVIAVLALAFTVPVLTARAGGPCPSGYTHVGTMNFRDMGQVNICLRNDGALLLKPLR
jgi:hypothetical protein